MTPDRRKEDKQKIRNFFKGAWTQLLLTSLTIILTSILLFSGKTFVSLPRPSDYAEKSTVEEMKRLQKEEITRLQADKLGIVEYNLAHAALKESIDAKLNIIAIKMDTQIEASGETKKLLTKLLNMHLIEGKK
jgi:hypothetical protein